MLELSSPLQCRGFITGSTIAKSEHLLYGSWRDFLSVPGDPRGVHFILWDTLIWKVTYSATHQWDPGISPRIFHVHSLGSLQLFDSYALRSSLCLPMLLLECNHHEILDRQILHLIIGNSALSKVELTCLHTLESPIILLADKWKLELFAASVMFHVISTQKLNTIVMRLVYSQPWHPTCKHYFTTIAQLSESFICYYDVVMLKIMCCFIPWFSSLFLQAVHTHSVIGATFVICT
jgi:hypothetical protein